MSKHIEWFEKRSIERFVKTLEVLCRLQPAAVVHFLQVVFTDVPREKLGVGDATFLQSHITFPCEAFEQIQKSWTAVGWFWQFCSVGTP